ncbi:MAG: 4Fe-4S dicluster domain-containing protein [Coriobacteriales bacterium]|jgi:heterodisulfide reductase subunit C
MDACSESDARAQAGEAIASITEDAGVNLRDCYQCGKCSGGCPVAAGADLTPRQVIRELQLGRVDRVLGARMPWLCVDCGVCLARCPQSVDLPSLMEAICRYEVDHGCAAVREGPKFMDIFLDNLQRKGVSDEVNLAARYNIETGHLFQDVGGLPRMVGAGLIMSGGAHKLEDPSDVTRMVARLRAAPGQGGAGDGEQQGNGGGR